MRLEFSGYLSSPYHTLYMLCRGSFKFMPYRGTEKHQESV
jgi:hypothetical protein